jgi:hypothetical protein
MSKLLQVLESKFPTEISLLIISYIIIDDIKEKEVAKYMIEKQVYYIQTCKSWNNWWKKHKILTQKERCDYNIKIQETKLKDSVKEYFFIYNFFI